MAFDGIIIVLEAPLLRSPSMGSTVLQMIRKGEKVYIPKRYESIEDIPEFIPTFDRAGNEAFVPSRYVKFVTGTSDEEIQPIRYVGDDPTDYRLEEPIPKSYPFQDRSFLRASLAFVVGNNTTSTYKYDSPFQSQDFSSDKGVRIASTGKVNFDNFDRFYFGFLGIITTVNNKITFNEFSAANEKRTMFRAGPWLTYDAFKNERYRLAIGTGFTFNYHQSYLIVNKNLITEENIFSGFSLSPMTSTTFQITEILPNTDFLAGVDFSLFLPHSLKPYIETNTSDLWGENNQMSSGLKTQASLFIGAQFKY